MKAFSWLLVVVGCAPPFFLGGCSSPQKTYQDPLTYSFEAKPPSAPTTQSELQEAKEKVKENSQKIRAWEKRYLW